MAITIEQKQFMRALGKSRTKQALLKAELQTAQSKARALLVHRMPPILPSTTPSRLLDPSLFRQMRTVGSQPSTYL